MPILNDAIVRLYDTVFDRPPDAEGLAFWNAAGDAGHPLHAMADLFMTAPEFSATYGQPDNLSFVRSMYANVLDRAGEADGVAFWTNSLDQGWADRASIVCGFSESPEHIAQMSGGVAPVAAPEPIAVVPILATPQPVAVLPIVVIPEPPITSEPPPAPPDDFGPRPHFYGTLGSDTIGGTNEPDHIFGVPLSGLTRLEAIIPSFAAQDKGDRLEGWGGNDTLEGAGGDDALLGGDGDDILRGGPGADGMYGGPGADRYDFDSISDAHGDSIVFEDANDVLDFRGLGLAYRGTAEFEANGVPQLRWYPEYYAGGRPWPAQVIIDGDGNGEGNAWITVYGALSDASFLL